MTWHSTSGIWHHLDLSVRDGICVEEKAETRKSIISPGKISSTTFHSTFSSSTVFTRFAWGKFNFNPKSLNWHYLNIVSPKPILQLQFLCHARVCNSLDHSMEVVFILAVIGLQGTIDLFLSMSARWWPLLMQAFCFSEPMLFLVAKDWF